MCWIEWAWRGFFGYDWRDIHRTSGFTRSYELVARPGQPRSVNDLSTGLASAARLVHFRGIRFADASAILVQQLIACEEP